MTTAQYIVKGATHDLAISFPWSEGNLISVRLLDKQSREVEKWVKPLDQKVRKQYWWLIPKAQEFIDKLFNAR